jgi:class 3 adenylate cyclase
MALPIRFARSGDVSIAFHTLGDGPVDLVYVEGSYTHLELDWELPAYRRYCERLAEFSRLVLFDKRGMGMSDRVPGATTLETRMDDIRAVMDAVGSSRAVIMGESEGGPLALLFAAAHPERTQALVLQGAEVRERTDADWPWGESTPEEFEASVGSLSDRWGKGGGLAWLAPSVGDDPWLRELLGRIQLNAATPGAIEGFQRMAFEIDVRDVVPTVHVPTLVIHARGDRICHVENGRFIARTLPGARYMELDSEDHVRWWDPDRALSEIREFITGRREPAVPDRVLATLLFTDLVDSTARLAQHGDRRWRETLDAYRAAVRRELERHLGTEIDMVGDGLLATFDGPARAIRCAQAILATLVPLDLKIRAGVHTGEVERTGQTLSGIAVNVGARVAALGSPGEILVSQTVRDLVAGSGLQFIDRGVHTLKGVPDEWRIWAVAA